MAETKDTDKIHLSNRVRFRAVSDEGVLVHIKNGRVMVVNEVGIYIVKTLGHQDMTVAELTGAVTGAFDVDAHQARADVEGFLDQLRQEQAIDMVGVPEHGLTNK